MIIVRELAALTLHPPPKIDESACMLCYLIYIFNFLMLTANKLGLNSSPVVLNMGVAAILDATDLGVGEI
jgi:hypothetical protein